MGWGQQPQFFHHPFVAKTFEYSHNILKTLTVAVFFATPFVVVLVGPIYDAPAIVGSKAVPLM